MSVTLDRAVLDAALALAARDIAVFPVNADKTPACAGGFKAATTDPDRVRELFANGAPLIGVPTGAASGIDALDIDPRHGGDVWLGANEQRLGCTLIHTTRRGGRHYLYRHVEGMGCSAGKIAPGIDVRGDGGYIVWWPAAGCEVWLDWEVEAWPEWLLAAAPARAARVSSSPDVGAADLAPPSADAVVRLLGEMQNPDDLGRDEWVAVGLAAAGCVADLRAAGTLGDDGGADIRDAWIAWSDRWRCAQDVDAGDKWDSDFATRSSVKARWSTLLATAARLGVDRGRYDAETVAARMSDGSEFDKYRDESEPEPDVALIRRGAMRDRFVFPADCETGPRRGYVIKHLIAPGDVGALIGPPSTGKSMLAPYLAYAVAQGRSAFGMRTKQGRTLYVAAEDFTGMRQRIHALKLNHGDAPDFATVDCGNLRDAATAADLRAAVATGNRRLLS